MEEFPAITGENALPVLQAFVDFVKADRVGTVGGPVRERRTDRGRVFVFDPDPQRFPGSFRVSTLGPKKFRIGEGEVNGRLPFLNGRDLAGNDREGNPHPDGLPTLEISEEPQARRSWICLLVLAVAVEGEPGEIVAGEEGLTIIHRTALPEGVPYGLDEEGRGLRPIAQLSWNADRTRVDRVRQVLHFDQEYRAPLGEDPRPEWRAAG